MLNFTNIEKVLATYQMLLHEAVDSFEDDEYQEMFVAITEAKKEWKIIINSIDNSPCGGEIN